MISISNRESFSKSEVKRNVLSFEISPGLRRIDLRPFVHRTIVHGLLCGNPVISASTETLALICIFFAPKVVKPVWEKIICLGSEPGNISCYLS